MTYYYYIIILYLYNILYYFYYYYYIIFMPIIYLYIMNIMTWLQITNITAQSQRRY
jgi:hypothetical protein